MDPHSAADAGAVPAPFPIKTVETLLFATGSVAAGTFRCAPNHPLFADSGPCSTYCFVFPRTSVWIRHAAAAPFVGNPSLVALYNEGQEYSRRPLSPDGDRSDWFAVAPAILEEALSTLDAAPTRGSRHLFPVPYVTGDARLYLAQRQLQEHLARGDAVDALQIEETILGLLERVLVPDAVRASRDARSTARPHALADAATAFLSVHVGDRLQLTDVANKLGCSVFHLCRAFRRATGTTIHRYRSDLRVRLALERLADAPGIDLTTLALDLGYCSHSHFTAAFRHAYGLVPSAFISSIAHVRRTPGLG